MAANILLGWPNRVDEGTLSLGSWLAGLPLTNLQDRQQWKVARSTDATLASTQFKSTWAAAKQIRAVALANHNLSQAATWRIKLSTPTPYSNVLLYSEQADNAAFTKVAATVSPNMNFAPDGALTADKMIESATTASHAVYQFASISTTIGQTYTVSVHLKAAERTQAAVELYSAGSVKRVIINLTDGSLVSASGTGTYTVTALAGGWYRVSVTALAAATVCALQVYLASSGVLSYAGNGTSGIFVWGWQLEQGEITGYKPTVATASNITILYDSQWQAVWHLAFDAELTTFESANVWEGIVDDDYVRYPYLAMHVLPDWYSAQYLSIEINDTANPDGYVQIGRPFFGGGFQPRYNPAYGLKDSWQDKTEIVDMQGGNEDAVEARRKRQVSFILENLSHSEGAVVHEMQRRLGIWGEVLYLPSLNDQDKAQRYGMLGRMTELSAIDYPYFHARSAGFQIKEL